ncbi:hypothetical protein CDD80_494 [Ophiocordyceps camponoti-rufipedis]|uniref:Putative phospholipase n=1 Tax=Ophiocordyceps camponoti-rufipedis TaxID=2004952 RepID=A0A2C5YJG0_9HYPO|nr:hypothetical protein CDD80_494 [Ophiocordyceps camponoti-rufipedis]
MPPNETPSLELDSLDSLSDPDLDPDSPLAIRPKWMPPPPSPSGRRIFTRRRLITALASFIAFYLAVCLLRAVPPFAHPLPPYSGQYAVASVDIEAPLPDAPRRVASVFDLESVLFTLYYPSEAAPSARHRPWLDRPIGPTARGYARLIGLDIFPIRWLFSSVLWVLAGPVRIPAAVDAPLVASDGDRLPVIVFSHGMASSRTDYTAYIGELASRGFIVAAVEHRDGSCPGSVIAPDRPVLALPSPAHLGSNLTRSAFKRAQMAVRTAEMLDTIHVLRALDAGRGPDILAANPRHEGLHLSSFRDRLALKDGLALAGHSMGATAVLRAVHALPAPVPVIALDPGKESGPLSPDDAEDGLAGPLLVLHSAAWSRPSPGLFYGRPHFDAIRDFVAASLRRSSSAWFLTGLDTAHPSISDAPLLEPMLLRLATGFRLHDPLASTRRHANLSAEFLGLSTGHAKRSTRLPPSGSLLAESVTHPSFDHWLSERRLSFPQDWASQWEIHVSPAAAHEPGNILSNQA